VAWQLSAIVRVVNVFIMCLLGLLIWLFFCLVRFQEGASVKTEAEIHDIHLLPPNEDPETCASWLRMRNRDGRYTLMFEEWVTEGNFIISPRYLPPWPVMHLLFSCSLELSYATACYVSVGRDDQLLPWTAVREHDCCSCLH
jgi:hypothetical protein